MSSPLSFRSHSLLVMYEYGTKIPTRTRLWARCLLRLIHYSLSGLDDDTGSSLRIENATSPRQSPYAVALNRWGNAWISIGLDPFLEPLTDRVLPDDVFSTA